MIIFLQVVEVDINIFLLELNYIILARKVQSTYLMNSINQITVDKAKMLIFPLVFTFTL
ncbi:MAG: hypothetical protein IPJ23_11625 [Ignavibacteriales bacterium]|nr:hypothetical protein [Ignavibacteriales bacterium]